MSALTWPLTTAEQTTGVGAPLAVPAVVAPMMARTSLGTEWSSTYWL